MKYLIKKVAVLSAGVKGAQIAAHLATPNAEAILFDLATSESDSENRKKSINVRASN